MGQIKSLFFDSSICKKNGRGRKEEEEEEEEKKEEGE